MSGDEDETFLLSLEDLAKIKSWIEHHRKDHSCHICGSTDWSVAPVLVTETIFDIPQDLHRHDKVMPMAVAVCNSCGVVNKFSGRVIGIKTNQEREQLSEDKNR